MNKLTGLLIGIGLVALAAIVMIKWRSRSPLPILAHAPSQPAVASSVSEKPSSPEVSTSAPVQKNGAAMSSAEEPAETATVAAGPPSLTIPAASMTRTSAVASFSPEVQILVSPQSSYAQKQAAWKQIRDAGHIEQAIAELDQAVKNDPSVAEYSAELGWAYLQKLAATQDTRQQAILAMQADQTFDEALKLDPNNWDARFSKAAALMHWPAEMNKSEEVMQSFSTLIDQQETRSPQPEYAQSYVLLGDQYLKSGYPDNAREMWQRGAAIFPNDQALQAKLAQAR